MTLRRVRGTTARRGWTVLHLQTGGKVYRPSQDPNLQRVDINPLWQALEPIFDRAIRNEPLPRYDTDILRDYVPERRDKHLSSGELSSRLPKEFDALPLGPAEIDVIDFLLHYRGNRVLALLGTRGVGKTSLLHFVEAAIQAAIPFRPYLFININGLALGQRPTSQDFSDLLREELEDVAERAPQVFQRAVAHALAELDSHTGETAFRRAARQLAKYSPEGDERRITFVFDNLDQLSASSVDAALDIAREVFINSRLGTLATLRPGSLRRVATRSRAAAFFQFTIDIGPPSVPGLLERLSHRLAKGATEHKSDSGRYPVVGTTELTPNTVHAIFERFARLMANRPIGDDATDILEAVSAADTRQLIALLRRLLAHRTLPVGFLLGMDEADTGFHPLSAMMEGARTLFEDRPELPNILSFTAPDGNVEYLLQHRILLLLSRERVVSSVALMKWLSQYAYTVDTAFACLVKLQRSALLDFSDVDVFVQGESLPENCSLTVAGHYYVHHLIALADYVIATVTDVTLQHVALRQAGPDWVLRDAAFAARFESAMEYLETVRAVEADQIQRLKTRPPSPELRLAADALRKGGLLTAAIHRALNEVVDRSAHATSPNVRRGIERQRVRLQAVSEWLQSTDQALGDVVNRGRRYTELPKMVATEFIGGEGTASLESVQTGDDVSLLASVDLGWGSDLALVSAAVSRDPTLHRVTVAGRQHGSDEPQNSALRGWMAPFDAHDVAGGPVSLQVVRLPQAEEGGLAPNKLGLLCSEVRDGKIHVRLHVVKDLASPYELGSEGSVTDIESVSKAYLREVGDIITGGSSAGVIRDAIRIAGTDLALRLLSKEGQNRLASLMGQLDTVVLHSVSNCIPWEWICPEPAAGALYPCIGDVWRIIRWPPGRYDGALLALMEQRMPGLPLATVGADKGVAGFDARRPNSMSELRDVLRPAQSAHLIGHMPSSDPSESAALEIGAQLRITSAAVRAVPLNVQSVLLSACGAGSMQSDESLPIAISLASNCVTWSPLVKVTESQALAIDAEMRNYLASHPGAGLDEFMRESRRDNPVLDVYVRYGLRASQVHGHI